MYECVHPGDQVHYRKLVVVESLMDGGSLSTYLIQEHFVSVITVKAYISNLSR